MPNYLGYCNFVPWGFLELRDAFLAVTGWPTTSWKLLKAVERGMTLIRLFNLREGFTRKDDRLPDRFYHSPTEGPLKEISIDPDELKEAQEAYYQMMGWDASGIPTGGCLVGLDL
jgi:aldehyde:ferredoxin oxidoreductase